jgi:hypothetical protein
MNIFGYWKNIKNGFFIFQKFFVESFSAGRIKKKIRIKIHFAFGLLLVSCWIFKKIQKRLLYFSRILR